MNKIFNIAFFITLALALGLNYGIYKYYDADQADFFANLEANLNGNAWSGLAYTTKDYNYKTGEWEMEWISMDNFSDGNNRIVGLVVINLHPEKESLKIKPKSHSWNAYRFAMTNGSNHCWNFVSFPPDKESIINTHSIFFKLEKRDFEFPLLKGHGQTMGEDITTIAQDCKEYYVRVSNGNIWIIVGIANALLIGICTLIFYLLFGSKMQKMKEAKNEIQLDKEQSLWCVLERKCNPNRYMSPYNKEMVEKSNKIYAQLQVTAKDDIESIKRLRREIESELGVKFIDSDELERLKAKVNPSNFMNPYNAEKVAIANELYAKLQEDVIYMDEYEHIKEQFENLLRV